MQFLFDIVSHDFDGKITETCNKELNNRAKFGSNAILKSPELSKIFGI